MASEAKTRKRVLFVDDSQEFLEIFSKSMEAYSDGEWEVFIASNAGKALSILEEHSVHLAVVDAQMPLIDGLQLLKLIGNKHPNLPKAVLTGFPSAADRATSLANGAELYLEKPTTPDGMHTIYTTLNELARVDSEEGFQGTLRRVGLHDILQMECLGRNSAVLEVFNKDIRGEIFIRNGSIIHAQAGDISGEDAFFHLLSISGGGFKLKPFAVPHKMSITKSWEHLLMESAALKDHTNFLNRENPDAAETAAMEIPDFLSQSPLRLPRLSRTKKEPVQINEIAVFSSRGDVLHEWQCPDVELRKRFLEFVSEKAKQLTNGLGLGRLDYVEMHGGGRRIVAQLQPDAGVYITATKATAASAA